MLFCPRPRGTPPIAIVSGEGNTELFVWRRCGPWGQALSPPSINCCNLLKKLVFYRVEKGMKSPFLVLPTRGKHCGERPYFFRSVTRKGYTMTGKKDTETEEGNFPDRLA